MKRFFYALIVLSLLTVPLSADKIISDPTLGYSIYLPADSWVRVVKSATHHQFYDTTFTNKSQVSIVRHSYASADFPTPESWTRANFIAYKLCVEYSFNPFGAMLYYDTAATVRQGISWATESYAAFMTIDTGLGAWSEFTRYTARNGYGWELYAIGDTADMKKNIGLYAGIIRLITLPGDTGTDIVRRTGRSVSLEPVAATRSGVVFDPMGRSRAIVSRRLAAPSGIFIRPEARRVAVIVK